MSTDGYLPPGVTDWDIDEAAGGHDPCSHRKAFWNDEQAILYCPDCGEELSEEELREE